MREYTAVEVEGIARNELRSDLEKLLREGARQMLEVALQTEVAEYTERHQGERDERGRRLVVRNGFHPPRQLVTGVGKVPVRQPRVDDRREGAGFTSAILPRYARRTPSIDVLLPALYLKGLSTSSFPEALKAILGDQVSGLSPANIVRLKQVWEKEYATWRQRDLSGKRYAYVWVDGIYFNVRLQPDRPCVLVVVGATHDGRKELLAVVDGERESYLSWRHLLEDLKARGLTEGPCIAVGDRALGFWKALRENVSPHSGAAVLGAQDGQCVGQAAKESATGRQADDSRHVPIAHQEGSARSLPALCGPLRSQVPQGV